MSHIIRAVFATLLVLTVAIADCCLPSALLAQGADDGALPGPQQLVSEIALAVPTAGDRAVCAMTDGSLIELYFPLGSSTTEGLQFATTPWQPDWTPEADGWERGGEILDLKVSPNGEWVMFAQRVYLPGYDELLPQMLELPEAVAVVVCRPDGTEARAVGLGYTGMPEWGEELPAPQYDFTTDSSRLVGHPFHPCLPDAEHYLEYGSAAWEYPPIDFFNFIDLATGERGAVSDLEIYEGYDKCPYSDYFLSRAYPPEYAHFGSLRLSGPTGVYLTAEGLPTATCGGWVLPDAVLYTEDLWQGPLYIDGQFKGQPTNGWEVYCWFPDGTYLFSNDGAATLKYGKVDWGTLTVDWWVERPDLRDFVHERLYPLPDSSGLLILADNGSLLYTPVSRAGAKP